MSFTLSLRYLILILLLYPVVLPGHVYAATTLDTSFDGDGKVVLDLGDGSSSFGATALLLQPDGKLLVAGDFTPTGGSPSKGIVTRLNNDGSLDPTFATGGTYTVDFGSFTRIYGLARQSNGMIIAVSGRGAFISDIRVLRLTAAGILDTTFAGDGTAEISNASVMEPDAVVIQPDGRIVVTASGPAGGLTVFRLNSDGTLDTSFQGAGSSPGFASASISGFDQAHAVALTADAPPKIVVVGSTNSNTFNSGQRDFAVARFNSDGTLDTTFDGDGMKSIDIAIANPKEDDDANAVLIQPDGKIVIAGTAGVPNSARTDCALIRLNADGSFDTGFDTDGKATFNPGGLTQCESLTRQADGTFIVSGTFAPALPRMFMVMRILGNGLPDVSFDSVANWVVMNFTSVLRDSAVAHVVQDNGKIILAGVSSGINGNQIALARFQSVAEGTQRTFYLNLTGADGTVASSAAGINCSRAGGITSGDCSKIFPVGTSFTLTASPNDGSLFTGWSGSCTGTSQTCSLVLDVTTNVTANFVALADTTAPTGSIAINSFGALYANSPAVTLVLSCTDSGGCATMQFSNDISLNWTVEETYTATKPWNLLSGDGIKTVYVKFKDVAGNLSIPFSATITLDTAVPITTANPIGGEYRTTPLSVTLSVNEPATIYYTTDGTDPTTSSPVYAATPIPIYQTTTLKFFAKDRADNSEIVTTQIYSINQNGMPGEINNDTRIDLADAILALQIFIGKTPQTPLSSNITADINGDHKIGMEEVIFIMQKAADIR